MHPMISRRLAVAALGLMLAQPAVAQDADTADQPPMPSPPEAAPGDLVPDTPSITQHRLEIPSGPLAYTAEAGTLPLRDNAGAVLGEIFHVAYTLDGPAAETRPITFVFNGGPGAAAAFLHLGALGPRVVAFRDNGGMPPPPARLVDNPATWLAFTDLVFIDPIGTGYSRATGTGDETRSRFWGVRQDLDAMAAFIRLYLTRADRWESPKFLAGESYGGFRAAALASLLPEDHGIGINGALLISPVIEFSLISDDEYMLLPWALRLPSYVAARHLNADPAVSPHELASALAAAEAYARSDYLVALAAGDALDPEAAERFHVRVAQLTGLPVALVARHRGQIPTGLFVREAQREADRVLSAYDATISAADPDPGSPYGGNDPVLDAAIAPFTTAFNAYVRDQLGFRTDAPYRLLNREPSRRWEYENAIDGSQGYVGAAENLESALALDPALRVMIAHGYTDLVTPYLTSRYVVDQMDLPDALKANIRFELYRGGHMMYTRPDTRDAFRADAAAFYENALSAIATGASQRETRVRDGLPTGRGATANPG